MAVKTLPLETIVNVIVNLSARAAARRAFDTGMILGVLGAGVDFGDARVRSYTGVTDLLSDGFATTDRLYKAATLYFGQAKTPKKLVVGKLVVPETLVSAFQACREADGEWYVGAICASATDEELLAVAAYVESVRPTTVLAFTTTDAAAYDPEDGGIFKKINNLLYGRTIGQYSTTHPDAIVAIIGWAMGAMTGTINSAYTLAFKTEVGVETENANAVFPQSRVEAIKGHNGNVYVNRGSYYNLFEDGVMGDGTWFDECIFLDKLQNDMQLNIMDLLYQSNKLPQTESGMTRIKNACQEVCQNYYRIGFLDSGVWNSADVLSLKYGDTLPSGYVIQSEPIDEQAQADRDARKAPPIYTSLKLSGAIHNVTIQVDVNR